MKFGARSQRLPPQFLPPLRWNGGRYVNVQIVNFPETRVAAIEHWGPHSNSNSSCRTRRDTAATAFTTLTQGPRQLPSTTSSFACPSNARRSVLTASASWRRAFRPTDARSPVTSVPSRQQGGEVPKRSMAAAERGDAGLFPDFLPLRQRRPLRPGRRHDHRCLSAAEMILRSGKRFHASSHFGFCSRPCASVASDSPHSRSSANFS